MNVLISPSLPEIVSAGTADREMLGLLSPVGHEAALATAITQAPAVAAASDVRHRLAEHLLRVRDRTETAERTVFVHPMYTDAERVKVDKGDAIAPNVASRVVTS